MHLKRVSILHTVRLLRHRDVMLLHLAVGLHPSMMPDCCGFAFRVPWQVSKLRVRSRARSADGAKSGVMGRMIDRNKLSVPKWGKVSADLESRCRQQGNLSSVPHLRSVDGMHLTYPDTWKGVDFIFHKVCYRAAKHRL